MSRHMPSELLSVLPKDTARSWQILSDRLPESMVLYGGTALAAHLQHRVSRDLDFFFDDPAVDLTEIRNTLEDGRPTSVIQHAPHTLNAIFGETKLQFLFASGQTPIEPPTQVAGLRVARLRDIAATKIKVMGDRGALRDYFDLKVIEERTGITVMQMLADYQERYADSTNLQHLIMSLGYFGDVDDDPSLPLTKTEIAAYWADRPAAILKSMSDSPSEYSADDQPGYRMGAATPEDQRHILGDRVWVPPHLRNGKPVKGHYRRR